MDNEYFSLFELISNELTKILEAITGQSSTYNGFDWFGTNNIEFTILNRHVELGVTWLEFLYCALMITITILIIIGFIKLFKWILNLATGGLL